MAIEGGIMMEPKDGYLILLEKNTIPLETAIS